MSNIIEPFMDGYIRGISTRYVEFINGELVVTEIPFEDMFIGFDPALPGSERTECLEFAPGERRYMIHVPYSAHHTVGMDPMDYLHTKPQPNHPDGWYRKFEKRQRGPKCHKK